MVFVTYVSRPLTAVKRETIRFVFSSTCVQQNEPEIVFKARKLADVLYERIASFKIHELIADPLD